MTDESVAEVPGQTTGTEEADTGVMTVEDLAATFVERVESEGENNAAESEAEGETPEADAEEESAGEDVLSKSISEEGQDEEAEDEGEEESEPEEEAAEEPKGVGKLLKQVNKLTARAKGSEEMVAGLRAEIAALKTRPAEQAQTQQGSPALEDVATMQDLEKIRQEALSAKKWAMSHIGKEFVEEGEKEYSGDEIREVLAHADEYLTEKIPARASFLQQRGTWTEDAVTTFPWLLQREEESSSASDLRLLYGQIANDPKYSALLAALPNKEFVTATLVKGIEAVKAEQKGKPKPKGKRKKAPPSPEDSVAPPTDSKETRKQKKRAAKLGKGVVSQSQLAAYLSE